MSPNEVESLETIENVLGELDVGASETAPERRSRSIVEAVKPDFRRLIARDLERALAYAVHCDDEELADDQASFV